MVGTPSTLAADPNPQQVTQKSNKNFYYQIYEHYLTHENQILREQVKKILKKLDRKNPKPSRLKNSSNRDKNPSWNPKTCSSPFFNPSSCRNPSPYRKSRSLPSSSPLRGRKTCRSAGTSPSPGRKNNF